MQTRLFTRATAGAALAVVAAHDDLVVAGTARGQLVLIRDLGGSAPGSAVSSANREAAPITLRASRGPLDLCATAGRIWVHTGSALLMLGAPDQPLTTRRERGVIAIAACGPLMALVQSEAGAELARLRGDDEAWQSTPLPEAARRLVEGAGEDDTADAPQADRLRFTAAAGGRLAAIAAGGSVAVSRDGGVSFELVALDANDGIAAITFAGDEADAPLLVLAAKVGGSEAAIVRVRAGGAATRVASVLGVAPDRPAAIAWDAAREVVWVACAGGLLAFGKTPRH